jgi:hypothetical protein
VRSADRLLMPTRAGVARDLVGLQRHLNPSRRSSGRKRWLVSSQTQVRCRWAVMCADTTDSIIGRHLRTYANHVSRVEARQDGRCRFVQNQGPHYATRTSWMPWLWALTVVGQADVRQRALAAFASRPVSRRCKAGVVFLY